MKKLKFLHRQQSELFLNQDNSGQRSPQSPKKRNSIYLNVEQAMKQVRNINEKQQIKRAFEKMNTLKEKKSLLEEMILKKQTYIKNKIRKTELFERVKQQVQSQTSKTSEFTQFKQTIIQQGDKSLSFAHQVNLAAKELNRQSLIPYNSAPSFLESQSIGVKPRARTNIMIETGMIDEFQESSVSKTPRLPALSQDQKSSTMKREFFNQNIFKTGLNSPSISTLKNKIKLRMSREYSPKPSALYNYMTSRSIDECVDKLRFLKYQQDMDIKLKANILASNTKLE